MTHLQNIKNILIKNDNLQIKKLIDGYAESYKNKNELNKTEIRFVLDILTSVCKIEEIDYLMSKVNVPLESISSNIEYLLLNKPQNYMKTLNYLLENPKVEKKFSSHTHLKELINDLKSEEIMLILESIKNSPEKLGMFIRTFLVEISNRDNLKFINDFKKVEIFKDIQELYPNIVKSKICKEVFRNSFNSKELELAQYLLEKNKVSQEYLYDSFYLQRSKDFKVNEHNIQILINNNFALLDNNFSFFKNYIMLSKNEQLTQVYGQYVYHHCPENLEKLMSYAKEEINTYQEKFFFNNTAYKNSYHTTYDNLYRQTIENLEKIVKQYEKYQSTYKLSYSLENKNNHTTKNKI